MLDKLIQGQFDLWAHQTSFHSCDVAALVASGCSDSEGLTLTVELGYK